MIIQSCCASSRRIKKCHKFLLAESERNSSLSFPNKKLNVPLLESPLYNEQIKSNLHLADFSNQNLG